VWDDPLLPYPNPLAAYWPQYEEEERPAENELIVHGLEMMITPSRNHL
jgi:hypothetical protein